MTEKHFESEKSKDPLEAIKFVGKELKDLGREIKENWVELNNTSSKESKENEDLELLNFINGKFDEFWEMFESEGNTHKRDIRFESTNDEGKTINYHVCLKRDGTLRTFEIEESDGQNKRIIYHELWGNGKFYRYNTNDKKYCDANKKESHNKIINDFMSYFCGILHDVSLSDVSPSGVSSNETKDDYKDLVNIINDKFQMIGNEGEDIDRGNIIENDRGETIKYRIIKKGNRREFEIESRDKHISYAIWGSGDVYRGSSSNKSKSTNEIIRDIIPYFDDILREAFPNKDSSKETKDN